MKVGAGVVNGFHSSVVSGGFALRRLAGVRLEDDVGTFVDACVIELESSESTDVIGDVVQEVEFEGA